MKLLKRILRLFSAYNFDVILDKDIRSRDIDKFSIVRGGNKELYDSIREIEMQTRQQLGEFANAGLVIWLNYISKVPYDLKGSENTNTEYLMTNEIDVQDQPIPQRVYPVIRKLEEILILLNPIEYGFSGSASLLTSVTKEIPISFEESFAKEVTAFYYFHLYFDYEFNTRFSTPMNYYSLHNSRFPISSRPKECLSLIIQDDKQEPLLREWFHKWMEDISSLQMEIYNSLKSMV